MRVELVTPQELATSVDKAAHVSLPGQDGRFGVLPGHMALIATLKAGEQVDIDLPGGARRSFKIGKGFVEITPEQVTILVDQVTQAA